MATNQIQGNLFFTLSVLWKGEPISMLPDGVQLVSDLDAANEIQSQYKVAHRFVFDDRTARTVEVQYLGTEFTTPTPEVGKCRIDFTQTRYPVHTVNVLSLHFKPLAQRALSNVLTEMFLRGIAFFMSTFMYQVRGDIKYDGTRFGEIWNFAKCRSRRDDSAQPVTFLTYVSLCNVPADQYTGFLEQHARTIYGLLFAHAEGVSEREARGYLTKHAWTSTEFCTTYFQPGALVTISRGHPPSLHESERSYFLQEWLNEPPTTRLAARPPVPGLEGKMNPDYDRLPEYPPLRYLGLLTGISSAIYEENMRDAYYRLLRVRQRPPSFLRPLRYVTHPRELDSIAVAWATTTSFENLRLPVCRYFARELINSKQQENLAASITSLGESNLNSIVLALTMIAIVVPVLQATLDKVASEKVANVIKVGALVGLSLLESFVTQIGRLLHELWSFVTSML